MNVKNLVGKVPGVRKIKKAIFGSSITNDTHVKYYTPDEREMPSIPTSASLKERFANSFITNKVDTFILYRIIGNDLIPRHAKGQSRKNLAFILKHEAEFENCEKRFIVNRIVDSEEELEIIKMLEEQGMPYLHIPFDKQTYHSIPLDIEGIPEEYLPYTQKFSKLSESQKSRIFMRLYRYKNNYIMNNNGARNAALQEGKSLAKWIMPWDGNCFITKEAWQNIIDDIAARSEYPYFIVPMVRLTNNDSLFEEDFVPDPKEEPQIAFRCDSTEEFSSEYYYGRRPKVELFWRLGVAGPWDRWAIEPWDLECPPYSPDFGAFARAGWVARLFSGQAHLENTPKGLIDRGVARNNAIRGLLDHLDVCGLKSHDKKVPCFIDTNSLSDQVHQDILGKELKSVATKALERGPYSVIDKTTLPPSKDPKDYWHPAPYYWPNPIPIPGLPYVPRDGQRVPGTRLYEPMSDNYDRTRLQRLFDDTFVLALAGTFENNYKYDQHAVQLVRAWFIDPDTSMNPHLRYAQVRRGWNDNQGSSSGIIEAKDFYFFLDGVRLLESRGAFSQEESTQLRKWLGQYLEWLRTSPQGIKERAATNNHGTYYDLQVGAIAAFLGEFQLLRETFLDSRCRIVKQFTADGMQPEEMKRTTTAHYCCFNLQGWVNLAQLAESCGEDLWSFKGPEGQSLRKGIEWLLPFIEKDWPYQQINEFDKKRLYPLYFTYLKYYGEFPSIANINPPPKQDIKTIFFPHDAIRPFWQL